MSISGVSQTSILIALGVIVTVGVFGAVMSPENTVQIIGFCSLISVSLLALLKQIETDRHALVAAEKAEDNNRKLDNLTEVTDKTLEHVNHDRTMLLQTIAIAHRRVAEGPQATDVDKDLADKSQKLYLAHVEQQEKMDARSKPKIKSGNSETHVDKLEIAVEKVEEVRKDLE
jgi:hypothetical protein